jgi:biopolymer transport protein ExbD
MAEVNTEGKGGKGKGGKQKKKPTRVDFTPMVDLGFLLITFFMLTTSMLKPQTMEIAMPARDKVSEVDQNKVKASEAITVILDENDRIYYYFGLPDPDVFPELIETDFSPTGIRSVLLRRNREVMLKINELKKEKEEKRITDDEFKQLAAEAKETKGAPVVMIKSGDRSLYKNLVDILDEMHICNIGKYAIVDITPYDTTLVYYNNNPNEINKK